MSMFRSIQASVKYVPTRTWLQARDELLFSKLFDRMTELRNQSNWSALQMKAQAEPLPKGKTAWDWMLEGVRVLAGEFREEREWKRAMAKQLAFEASMVVLAKGKFTSLMCTSAVFSFEERELLETLAEQQVPLLGFPGKKVTVPLLREMVLDEGTPLFLQPRLLDLEDTPAPEEDLQPWSQAEDLFLQANAADLNYAWKILAQALNSSLYSGRVVRSPLACHNRYLTLADATLSESEVSMNNAKRHLEMMGIMRGATTRLITQKAVTIGKNLTLTSHASHDAAVRKANMNISKILTPHELALRRIQRQGSGLTSVGTPLPMPSSVGASPGKSIRPPLANPSLISQQQQQQQQGMAGMRKPVSVGGMAPMYRPPPGPNGGPPGMSPMPIPPAAAAALQMQQRMARPPLNQINRQQMMMYLQQQQQQQQQQGGAASPLINQMNQMAYAQLMQQQQQQQHHHQQGVPPQMKPSGMPPGPPGGPQQQPPPKL